MGCMREATRPNNETRKSGVQAKPKATHTHTENPSQGRRSAAKIRIQTHTP